MDSKTIVVVSGLPRSGTSMMMKMLAAGGMEVLTDNLRAADEDNPKGYFEFEKVKELERDSSWLADAGGKVVKVISALLKHLPPNHQYKVIFMHRKMEEILASQKQMMIRRGESTEGPSDERMAEVFAKHLGQVDAWLAAQPNIEVIYVEYKDILSDPARGIEIVNDFLYGNLDRPRMIEAVDRSLYRHHR